MKKNIRSFFVTRRSLSLLALSGLASSGLLLFAGWSLLAQSGALPDPLKIAAGAVVRHAPQINGRVEGSVRMLTGEAVNLNGGAVITGDLLAPGTPTTRLNGNPTLGSTLDGTGSAAPSNYQITLSGNASLGRLVRRMDAIALPTVTAPPASTGTRDVTISGAGQSIGDAATLRDLTLNGNVGNVAVPPGTYRRFTANGGGGFILGTAGATQSTLYNLNSLNLNGNSQLQVVGPVTLVLASGLSFNGQAGSSANPLWLTVKVAAGDVTLNGGSSVSGILIAPNSRVTINGNSQLTGTVLSDELTLNGNSVLQGRADTVIPTIALTQPGANLITKLAQVVVAGTITDSSETTVKVNGNNVPVSGGNFSTNVTLNEGSNTIQVVATDLFGNQATVTRTVARDSISPQLTITQPAAGAVINAAQVSVSGTVTDASAVTVTVNGVAATLNNGGYTATIPLSPGANTIRVIATDAAGNQAELTRTVTRQVDTTPPTITITSPAENSVTKETLIPVTGTFSDESLTTITVDGRIANAPGATSFSGWAYLTTEGTNRFSIVGLDAFGNRTEVIRTVILDTVPPTLNVTAPANYIFTRASQLEITGNFADATSLTVNGVTPTINGANFRMTVTLSEGLNKFPVVALDAAGNKNDTTLEITRDTLPPVITLFNPAANERIKMLKLDGRIVDATQVTVTVDGAPVALDDGLFKYWGYKDSDTFPDGVRQVRVVARDEAGNQSEMVRPVIMDNMPPQFSNISPEEDSVVKSPVRITGRVIDAGPVVVNIGVLVATVDANGNFTFPSVPLREGQNDLLIEAEDDVGNSNDTTLTLIGGDQAPPSAPSIFPVNSPTRLSAIPVGGLAESGSTVTITGGAEPVTASAASGSGLFLTSVKLNIGTNNLRVVARDADGNTSTPALVSIVSNPSLALPPVGSPALINVATGNAQKGLVNTALPRPLIALVTDRNGTPVSNAAVRFTAEGGGGRFVNGVNNYFDTTTNAQGYAQTLFIAGVSPGAQQIRADFTGNISTPAYFLAEALAARGGETTVSGVVLDQNLRSLPNVLVRLGGQQIRTGVDGTFTFRNVASGPHQLLELIGRNQITLPGRWPNITYDLDVLPGIDNQLNRPLFLPKVNDGVIMPLDANNIITRDTTYDLPVVAGEPLIRITAKTGTRVTFPPDATDKRLSVTRIAANRIPMPLDNGRATSLYISVQPSGAIFDPPLEISLPNLDRVAANKVVSLMSFDHDAGRYVKVGIGHVTADGREVKSDPGNGIRVGAWHAAPPEEDEFAQVIVNGYVDLGDLFFRNKVVTSERAWVEETAATLISRTTEKLAYTATLTVPAKAPPRLSRMEAKVEAVEDTAGGGGEKKLAIKFNSSDERFAPSVERYNFKYTITQGTTPANTATEAKLEIFKAGGTTLIYADALPTTADKLDYRQSGTVGWDGKMNQGADNGKYIEPKDGPFLVRISASCGCPNAPEVKAEKSLNVEIESMKIEPVTIAGGPRIVQDGDNVNVFKPNVTPPTPTPTEIDARIQLTIKVRNKDGRGVVTTLPFHIFWSFEDPDDTASNNIVDTNGDGDGGVNDNEEVEIGGVANGGKRGSGTIMWKAIPGITTKIDSNGQKAESDVERLGGNIIFSTSVMAGDNYKLIAEYKKDDGTSIRREISGRWSVWKRLEFQHIYRMDNGADVTGIMTRGNINPAYSGDGYTEYYPSLTRNLPIGAQSPVFVANLLPPLPVELPAAGDTQPVIDAKAQAWFNRNSTHYSLALVNLANLIGAPAHSIVGAQYYHPKLDGNPDTGNPINPATRNPFNYYPPATRINVANANNPPDMKDPDGEWRAVQGVTTSGDVAFIFLNITSHNRNVIVGRHEVGHASDHIDFSRGDGNRGSDHASSGLMEPTSGQTPLLPDGSPDFSPRSIIRLRGSIR